MTTQLRLVDDVPRTRRSRDGRATPSPTSRTRAARVNGRRQPRDRRVVQWDGAWRLDGRTRAAGQRGVAAARQALERAAVESLRRAS